MTWARISKPRTVHSDRLPQVCIFRASIFQKLIRHSLGFRHRNLGYGTSSNGLVRAKWKNMTLACKNLHVPRTVQFNKLPCGETPMWKLERGLKLAASFKNPSFKVITVGCFHFLLVFIVSRKSRVLFSLVRIYLYNF